MSASNDGGDREGANIFWNPLNVSLRDYFAGQALGAMAKHVDYSNWERQQGFPEKYAKEVAQAAFMFADAMLKAREGKP
jgi:hypothetical protein